MNLLKKTLPALLALCFASAAHANVTLIATGSMDGNLHDLSTQTGGPLENGVAGNLLGGLGSGLAWAGGNHFIAVPDRGPNATAYNPLVDDTSSYINRMEKLTLTLTPNSGTGLPFTLTPTLTGTTLLSSSTPLVYGTGAMGTGTVNGTSYTLGSGAPALNTNGTYYFTGRSDGFDPTKNSEFPSDARLDPESIRVSNDGKTAFISDEYGPFIYQFDVATGKRVNTITLPSNLAVTNLSSQGATEISGNTVGRVANKGMEGLALTPDGKTLVGIMQAPLEQDTNGSLRIVTVDVATGVTHEYAYKLTTGSGVSDIVALNDHQFLVDERDGKGLGDGSNAKIKQVFLIDLNGAQDVSGMSGDLSSKAVGKSLFLDVAATLNANGYTPAQVPSKIEGLAFGQDVTLNGVTEHTLFIANDNDFVPSIAGDNKWFVFGFSDADLAKLGATFQAEQFSAQVPEPQSAAMLMVGLMSLLSATALRRKSPKK